MTKVDKNIGLFVNGKHLPYSIANSIILLNSQLYFFGSKMLDFKRIRRQKSRLVKMRILKWMHNYTIKDKIQNDFIWRWDQGKNYKKIG